MPRKFSTAVLDTLLKTVEVEFKVPLLGFGEIKLPVSEHAKEWWKNEKARRELLNAINVAEQKFVSENPENKAAQILHDFSLKNEEEFQKVIAELLNHLDEQKITWLMADKLGKGFEHIVDNQEIQNALTDYIPYLRNELSRIRDFREVIAFLLQKQIANTTALTYEATREIKNLLLEQRTPKDKFTDEWFIEQTELSILELGKRYTPEFNVQLDISKIFDAIARDEIFEKQIMSIFDEFFIHSRKIDINDKELEDDVSELRSKLKNLYQIVIGRSFQGVDILPYAEIGSLLDSIDSFVEGLLYHFLELERKLQEEKKEHSYYQKYGSEIESLRSLSDSLEDVREFILGISGRLSNTPILLLDGDAGIGKSHLIADVVRNRNIRGKLSLFF